MLKRAFSTCLFFPLFVVFGQNYIDKKFKPILLILFVASFSFISVYSQKGTDDGSKYGQGKDSIECLQNLSLYREYIRQSDFESAYPYWQNVFTYCPKASKNIYIDGTKIIRYKLDSASDGKIKKALIDSLIMIYDNRIVHFGEKGEVLGRQGVDLLLYGSNGYLERAHVCLKESILLEKENSSETVLFNYISSVLLLYKNNKYTSEKVIEAYILTNEIITSKAAIKPTRELQNLKLNIEDNFANAGPANCDTFVYYFTEKLKSEKGNTDFLRSLTNILRRMNCTKNSLFLDCSKQLHAISPTAESALNIAVLAYQNENYQEAVEYYKQAAELEPGSAKKAEYYYNVAIISNIQENKAKAREYALKAAVLRQNWGDPYLLIGQMYADSKDLCASLTLPNAVFWIAVDMFNKAKLVDPSIEEKADKLIQTYSKYFPKKEEAFFLNVIQGNSYSIGCWINETTKARFDE